MFFSLLLLKNANLCVYYDWRFRGMMPPHVRTHSNNIIKWMQAKQHTNRNDTANCEEWIGVMGSLVSIINVVVTDIVNQKSFSKYGLNGCTVTFSLSLSLPLSFSPLPLSLSSREYPTLYGTSYYKMASAFISLFHYFFFFSRFFSHKPPRLAVVCACLLFYFCFSSFFSFFLLRRRASFTSFVCIVV